MTTVVRINPSPMEAVKSITRSGTTFTATRLDGTTFEFTQQDSNTVTRVKGNAESAYRTGDVNLTPANIGALALSGGTLTGQLKFTESALPSAGTSSEFFVTGINQFVNGGRLAYKNVENTKSWLGLGSLAYKSSLAAADIPALPTSKVTGLGTWKNVDVSAEVSCASGAWKVVGSLTGLTAGTWVISYGVSFASNATGRRQMAMDTDNDTAAPSETMLRVNSIATPAASGAKTRLRGCLLSQDASNKYLKVYQNSGSTLGVTCNIRAVRIA